MRKTNSLKFMVTILIAGIQLASPVIVSASSLQDQLNAVNSELQQIQDQKNTLQSQLDSSNYTIGGYNSQLSQLYGELKLYEDQLKELELQLQQLDLQIQIINADIDAKKAEIKQAENTVTDLEKESDSRIKDSYISFRMRGSTDESSILNVNNINTYFKTSQYKEIIQSDTNQVINKLSELKQELQDKKKELDDKLIQVKKDKEVIDVKKVDLEKKKEEADVKAQAYESALATVINDNNYKQMLIRSYSEEEVKKKAESNYLQQQIFNNFSPIGSGQYVLTGTQIGLQGCTGLCTGAHLHFMVTYNGQLSNPCAFLAGGVCGWGDGSLVKWPLNPVTAFTSGFGNRCFDWGGAPYCDFHTGIDIIGSYWNAPVFAANDGWLYKGVDQYGANYVIICQNSNCNSGIKTGYWHLSAD